MLPFLRPRPPRRRLPLWARALIGTLLVPPVLAGLFCLQTAYKIYVGNQASEHLPPLAPPRVGQRILVFSPHPDDETLGAAGLIRQAKMRGDDVRVVFLTNGDGFGISAAREFHEITVPPKDFVRYAYLRQDESRKALGVLGVPPADIHFLGYPDRGLMPMWIDHWNPDSPVESAYTRVSNSPYDDSPTPHAPYCGASLLADIRAQMEAEQPTDVYITHPNDDHPDHAAGSVFVRTALHELKAEGIPWAQTAQLHYFIVHRGDWPVPQGLNEEAPLVPPSQLARLDTDWSSLPLSHRDVQRKYAAIKRYQSQVDSAGRFLYSFARRNELFGTLGDNVAPALAVVPDGRFHMDGRAQDWAGQTPVALDPNGDSVLRAFQSSADIVRLYACRDSTMLYLRQDMQRPLSSQVTYAFTLRPLTPAVGSGQAPPPSRTLLLTPGPDGKRLPVPGLPGGFYAWHGTLLEAALPLSALHLQSAPPGTTLYLRGQTRLANVEVDHTGFRPAEMHESTSLETPASAPSR